MTLWDVASGKARLELKGHLGWVSSVAIAPDGTTVVSASEDKTGQALGRTDGPRTASFSGHPTICRVAVSPRGDAFATAGEDKTVKLWSSARTGLPATLVGHRSRVFCAAFSPDGKALATGAGEFDEDNPSIPSDVIVWDIEKGTPKATLSGHTRAVVGVAFSPDGKTLATAGSDNRMRVWDLADGRVSGSMWTDRSRRGGARSVSFSPDGALLAISFWPDPTVKIVDARTGVELTAFSGHNDGVYAVQFSPDGKTLATGSIDRTVKLWDVRRLIPTPAAR